MAAKRLVCNLQCPQKKFHLTSLPVLLIHFMALLPNICHSLGSSHSLFNSSTPLSKFNGDLHLTSSVETGISSHMSQMHLSALKTRPQNLPMPEISVGKKCDIFTGSWVHDSSYPLYDWTKCHYIPGQFNCQKNGRPNSDYQKWRWKPHDCNLTRFNALDFLQKLRGKKILFAGDSLTDNQWQSMLCLLGSVLPPGRTALSTRQGISTFKALDYGVSVSFQWAPYLVDTVNKVIKGQQKVVLELNSVELNAKWWVGQDILVFESGHWWSHNGSEARDWDYMQDGPHLYKDMDRMVAYRKGLTAWANWIDSNIDIAKTRVFYRGFSGTHGSASAWKNRSGFNCYNETQPILGSSYPGPYPPELQVAEDVLNRMSSHVSFLNITTLTLLRKDGHPSIYTTAKHPKNPELYSDCSHWCLPGVPDTWNELLYSALFF